MPKQKTWKEIPSKLHYLRPYVDAYGVMGRSFYMDDPLHRRQITEADVTRLKEAFVSIKRNNNLNDVSELAARIVTNEEESDVEFAFFGLLMIFDRYAQAGIEPFTEFKFVPEEPPLTFDWDRLPQELAIWKPFLKKYEHLQSEIEILEHLRAADESEKRSIEMLRQLINSRGDSLRAWSDCGREVECTRNEAIQSDWIFLIEYFDRCPSQ